MIVLAGTIGAGKSSLAKALGEHLGTDVYYEAVDNNPVLDLYYQDPKSMLSCCKSIFEQAF